MVGNVIEALRAPRTRRAKTGEPAPELAPAPAMGDAGKRIRIRMYRVGFGDFFLMSVPGPAGSAHILIDCGVHAHDIGAMPAAIEQMKRDTGGHLALVIATHRHADHISGFASGKAIFETFTVERVWMSWFEDPGSSTAHVVQTRITQVASALRIALAARDAPESRQYAYMAGNILGELGVAGGGTGNDLALRVLHSFKTPDGSPTPVDYYSAGQPAMLPPSLKEAGLDADILGPPTDLTLVAKMDNKAHQFLTGLAMDGGTATDGVDGRPPFASVFEQEEFPWPAALQPIYTSEEVRKHLADLQPDVLAAAADSANNAVNNQSLVVLFRFKGKTLLSAATHSGATGRISCSATRRRRVATPCLPRAGPFWATSISTRSVTTAAPTPTRSTWSKP